MRVNVPSIPMIPGVSGLPGAGLLSRTGAARLGGEWRSTQDRGRWPAPPKGEGRPAILIPGFLAGDPSLRRMGGWLRSGDYSMVRSGIRWNVGCMEDTVASVEEKLETVVEKTGKPALVVGQSRGGVIGRVLAVRRPELVDTLVTLGSPLRNQTDVHRRVWFSIGLIGGLGTAGVPGMLSLTCWDGDCCRRSRDEFLSAFPGDVNFVSFYSKNDTIVKYESCLDPAATLVEVESTHLGMGVDRALWKKMSAEINSLAT